MDAITLSEIQYCILQDPRDNNGFNQLGSRILKVGPLKFFLQPGENVEEIKDIYLLSEDQALLLTA